MNSLRRETHESKIKIIKLQAFEEDAKRLRKQLEASEEENAGLQLSVTNLEQKVHTYSTTCTCTYMCMHLLKMLQQMV